MKEIKIKILFVIGNLGVGGKERQLSELINNLPKEKYSTHLLVKNSDAYYLDRIKKNVVSFYSMEKEHFKIFDFVAFTHYINKIKPDIVCSWAAITSHFCLFAQFFAQHNFRLLNFSIRNAPIKLSASLQIERFMYNFYNVVISNSAAGLVAYNQNKKKNRYILHNGFDWKRVPNVSLRLAREYLDFPAHAFIVTMVANLTDKKDHLTFLFSAKECTKHRNNICFFLVGDGPKRSYLEKKVKQLGIQNSLFFLGQRDDVELILKAADVSVLTSSADFGEGISNSIIESLGCGTPVIASDNPGTREIIDDGIDGLIIPPGDYIKLSEMILLLNDHPEMIETLSCRGIEKIKSNHSLEKMVSSFINIVES